ncbi:MAG: methyltransferase domain-containing protein [Promethearchaeota archaeon]
MSVIYMLKLEEEPDTYDLQFNSLTKNMATNVRDWIQKRIQTQIQTQSQTQDQIGTQISDKESGKHRVLDLGCGPGTFTRLLAREGCLATGIDINSEMIRYANDNRGDLGASLSYIESSVTKLQETLPTTDSYDTILSMFLLTELRPLEQQILLRNIWTRLATGGRVYLAAEFPPRGIRKWIFNLRRQRYLRKLGRKKRGLPHPTANFKQYLEPIGFELITTQEWRHGEIQILELRKINPAPNTLNQSTTTIKAPGFFQPTPPPTLGWKGLWGKLRSVLTGQVDYIPIEPGIYTSGTPDASSPLLVTANYLYTYVQVHQDLEGKDAWILALDSLGINVWCAARGGNFGNSQLLEAVQATDITAKAKSKLIILPQLAAGGIKAPELPMRTEKFPYEIMFGPVYSKDLPTYLTDQPDLKPKVMRTIKFGIRERAVAGITHLTFLLRKIYLIPLLGIMAGALLLDFAVNLDSIAQISLYHLFWEVLGGVIWANLLLILVFQLTNFTRSFVIKSSFFASIMGISMGLVLGLSHGYWLYGLLAGVFFMWMGFFTTMSFSGYTPLTSVREIKNEYQLYQKTARILLFSGILLYLLGNVLKFIMS